MAETKRRGRKARSAKPGQRVSLGLKVTPTIKNKLDGEARLNGRTQSQEAEARIERTFDQQALLDEVMALAFGPQLAGLLMAIGHTMKVVGGETARNATQSYEAMDRWPEYRKAFDQAVNAANLIFADIRNKTVDAPFDEPVAVPKSRRKVLGERLAE